MVLNLGSIKPQEFGESISRVRRRSHTHTHTHTHTLVINYVQYLCFEEIIFLFITEGSVNAQMNLAGFSTSNKVKKDWVRVKYLQHIPLYTELRVTI